MGACDCFYKFDASENSLLNDDEKRIQKEVKKICDDIWERKDLDDARYSGDINTMHGPVQFKHKRFDTPKEAYDYIFDNHEKGKGPLAVKVQFEDGLKWLVGGWASI
jgi:hypothetical protein